MTVTQFSLSRMNDDEEIHKIIIYSRIVFDYVGFFLLIALTGGR